MKRMTKSMQQMTNGASSNQEFTMVLTHTKHCYVKWTTWIITKLPLKWGQTFNNCSCRVQQEAENLRNNCKCIWKSGIEMKLLESSVTNWVHVHSLLSAIKYCMWPILLIIGLFLTNEKKCLFYFLQNVNIISRMCHRHIKLQSNLYLLNVNVHTNSHRSIMLRPKDARTRPLYLTGFSLFRSLW